MLVRIFLIICVTNIIYTVCDGTSDSETKILLSMTLDLARLRIQQAHNTARIIQAVNAKNYREINTNRIEDQSNIQSLKEELNSLKEELKSLKTELEQERNDRLDKESVIKSLEEKLERRNAKKSDCSEITTSGVYELILPGLKCQPIKVFCDAETQGGQWTVILRRMDGSEDFYRNWESYKNGFGDLNGEFFLGLDNIHAITSASTQELIVILEDFDGVEMFEKYYEFAIGDESQEYNLITVGLATGNAGDSLSYHQGNNFTTYDRDNDNYHDNCAVISTGAWWYGDCHESNLAGNYYDVTDGKGVNWKHFRGYVYSLKRAVMMIRTRVDA